MELKPLTPEQSKRLIELRKQLKEIDKHIDRLWKQYENLAINRFELNVGLGHEASEMDKVLQELKRLGER